MARNKYPEETVKLILDAALKLFIEKGYENTSIQDILNHLGGLSKGAIYHHFKSKEEIFEGVCKQLGESNTMYFTRIRDNTNLNGYEKLKVMIESAYTNPNNKAVVALATKILSDPKFFMNQIKEIFTLVVPEYVQPIIEEGVRDGSIQTDYPKELAEVIIVLLNIWVNPIITNTNPDEMRTKLTFINQMLIHSGLTLFTDETMEQYVAYAKMFHIQNDTAQ